MKPLNSPRSFTIILAALAAATACSTASAASLAVGVEATVANCGTNENVAAEYRSWDGLKVHALGPHGSVAARPDQAPGHLSYSLIGTATAPNGDYQTCLRRDEATGTVAADPAEGSIKLSAGSQGTLIIGAASAQYRDALTFTNNTGVPQQMTVEYRFHGTLSVTSIPQGPGLEHGHAGADARLEFHTSNFYASVSKKNDGDPRFNYANFWSDGWDAGTVEIAPQSGGANGATFRAGFTVPPGVHSYGIYEPVSVFARTGPAAALFQDTAALKIIVPPGLSFTSESGNFLTGIKAVSRKTHGDAGAFDIPLPLTGTPGVECRGSAVPGEYQIVVQFANPLNSSGAVEVSSGPGQVQSASLSGGDVTVNLTGLVNAQTTVVTLNDVSNGAINGDVTVPISLLIGDTNGNGAVNSGDATQTKNRSGQTTDATNFRSDVNADGLVNSGDATAVRSRSGSGL